jgi:hypothetical protein
MENVIEALQSTIQGEDSTNNKTCLSLLTEKINQIAENSTKVEDLTVELQQLRLGRREDTTNTDTDTRTFSKTVHPPNEPTVLFEQHRNISTAAQCTTNNVPSLEEYRQKNEALERSLATLKYKMAEREIKSAKNFRFMKQQVDRIERDRNRRMMVQETLQDQVAVLEHDIRCKDQQICELQLQLQNRNISPPTSVFRHAHHNGDNKIQISYKEEGVWEDEDGAVPPILVAASGDEDDTASEKDSQCDASEELPIKY